MGERPLQHWSQSDWIIFLSSQGPTIREIVECVGLLHINDRGEPKFSERELRRLSSEVQRLSQTLPTDPDALLRSAADPKALDEELDALLRNHGPAIWGEAADRKRLLTAAGTSKTSPLKELFFEVPADRTILKTHLHRWIYKKAHTSLQPRKSTKQSAARDVTTSSGDNAAQSTESRPAPPSVGSLQEALTTSSVTPPATTFDQRNSFMKRKVNLGNPVPNDCNATKRICQDTPRSVEQPLQEQPVSTLRRGSECVSDAPRDDAYPSHPPVHSAAATSIRPSMSSCPSSRHAPNAEPSAPSSLTSTFVAVNRARDDPITTEYYRPTSTDTASTLCEVSSLPVASSIPSNGGQMHASPLLNSQYQGRHGTTKSVQTPHGLLPPVSQVMIHHPRRLSQDNAARMLPSPPTDISELHHTTGHNTGQGHNSDRQQVPIPREATFEQCDLLWLLLRYLFPRVGEKIEVPILLRSLERVWASHEQDFKLAMDQRFDCHRKVLFIWINERRKTSQLQLMIDRQPSAHTLEMVDRVLVMNDLRILRLKWKMLKVHDGTQNSSPEDLLCSTFATMTRTEGTETLFKEGLDRLKETPSEVGRPDASVISIYS